jgi:hypothetical protein
MPSMSLATNVCPTVGPVESTRIVSEPAAPVGFLTNAIASRFGMPCEEPATTLTMSGWS